jgi:hypothetical protein
MEKGVMQISIMGMWLHPIRDRYSTLSNQIERHMGALMR